MQIIRQILGEFQPTGWGCDLLSAGFVSRLYQDHEGVHIQLRIPFAGSSWLDEMKAQGGRTSEEQRKWIDESRSEGYRAEVCVGADAAWQVICEYLGIDRE